jgi:S1-C subfamily serine protease
MTTPRALFSRSRYRRIAAHVLFLVIAAGSVGCAHTEHASVASPSTATTQADPSSDGSSAATAAPAEAAATTSVVGANGTLSRAAILPVLDAGLGRFLQGVSTEQVLEGGRFVGFRVLALYPNDARFRAVDLRAGDIVTRVNGTSIERPERAFEVWNGLRVASELVVDYRRGTEARTLRFAIVD